MGGAKKAAADEALVKDSTNEEKQTKAKEASTKEAETKVETKTKADERNFKQRRAKLEKEVASLSAGKPGNLVGAEADKKLLEEQWQKKKEKRQEAMQQEAKQQHVKIKAFNLEKTRQIKNEVQQIDKKWGQEKRKLNQDLERTKATLKD